MIHADWCGTCKGLKPVWERIRSDLAEQSNAVTFDVSDRPAYAESARAARELGIGEFFSEYRAKTGTIGILACDTQKPVAVLNGERDFETYRAAIEKAACKAS
jgi:thiol-disulfide isomerase/thioredoxin